MFHVVFGSCVYENDFPAMMYFVKCSHYAVWGKMLHKLQILSFLYNSSPVFIYWVSLTGASGALV